MRSPVLTVGVCLILLVGCKRGTKDTGPARDDRANAKLQPAPVAPAVKVEKKDEPNWLKDERVQPKTGQLPVDGPASSGKQPWNVGPPAGGFQQPVPGVQPTAPAGAAALPMKPPGEPNAGAPVAKPPAGGAAPVGNVPALAPAGNTPLGAAKRVVAMADMRDLQIFIHDSSLVLGRMPTGAEVYAALVEARSPAAALVKEGAIIVTGAKERESVWAFEARAYLNGGLVVTHNGVERVTAEELKKLLGK
ncbi:MAG TPA: hypothetical protein VGE74_01040 [Gemmata sp.]